MKKTLFLLFIALGASLPLPMLAKKLDYEDCTESFLLPPPPPLQDVELDLEAPANVPESLEKYTAIFKELLDYFYQDDEQFKQTLQKEFRSEFPRNLISLAKDNGAMTRAQAEDAYDAAKAHILFEKMPLIEPKQVPLAEPGPSFNYHIYNRDREIYDFTVTLDGKTITSSNKLFEEKGNWGRVIEKTHSNLSLYNPHQNVQRSDRDSIILQDPEASKHYRCCLAHSPTDGTIAFAQHYRSNSSIKISVFNPQTNEIKELTSCKGYLLKSLCFSANGRYLIGNLQGNYDYITHPVWNASTGELIKNPAEIGYFFPAQEGCKGKYHSSLSQRTKR